MHNLHILRGVNKSTFQQPHPHYVLTHISFSNYWTAVLFFRARNGTFKRVPIKGNVNFENSQGGMTVYYIPTLDNGVPKSKVTAFKKGFRMIIGKLFPLLLSLSFPSRRPWLSLFIPQINSNPI
jgi:hypothetical protein